MIEPEKSSWCGFVDPEHEGQSFLTKSEAENRSKIISEVSYCLTMGLVKGGGSFHGKVQIDFSLSELAPDY